MSEGLAASVPVRLLARAKERHEYFNLTLTRHAIERFLYRLSCSPSREYYWLKGALLFNLWFDAPHRPTRDADFLGFGPANAETLSVTMQQICSMNFEDGMTFDGSSIRIEPIREEARYQGLRVRLFGLLGNARSTVQIDIGYGDAVTPGPEEVVYPWKAFLSKNRLSAPPLEDVVAEVRDFVSGPVQLARDRKP